MFAFVRRCRELHGLARYPAAGALAVGALGLRLSVESVFGPFPLLPFFVATITAACLLGVGPGLLTAALGAGLVRWFLLEPRASLSLDGETAIAFATYLLIAVVIVLAINALIVIVSRLSATESRLRAIFDGTFDFIGLLEPDGRLIEANASALRFGGFAAADVVGRPFWEAPWWSLSSETRDGLRRAIERAAQGEFVRYEVDVRGKDDRVITIDFSLMPVRDGDGRVTLIVPEGRNITPQKLAEQERKRAADRLNDVFENISDAVAILDPDWRFVYMNQRARELASGGRSLVGLTHWEAFPETVGSRFEREYRGAVADRQVRRFEEWYEPLGKWFQVSACPTPDGLAIYFQDVTERRRAADSLRESEALYRSLAANLPNGAAFVVDRDLRYVVAEGAALVDVGLTPADLEGKTLAEALPPELAHRYEPHYRQALAGERFDWEHESHGRTYSSHGVPLRDPRGEIYAVLAVSYDITERKRAEAALRESEERTRLALRAAHAGAWDLVSATGEVRWSPENYPLFGLSEAAGPPCYEEWLATCVHPEDRESLDARFRAVVSSGRDFEIEYRIVHPDLGVRWMRSPGRIERDAADETKTRAIGLNLDFTEQKRVDEELRDSEARFRALIAATADVVWTTDGNGATFEDSPSWRAFTGQTYEEWIGWGWLDAIHADDRDRCAAHWRHCLANRLPYEIEYRLQHRSGAYRWTQARATPLLRPDGTLEGWVGLNSDITDRKLAEERQALLLREVNHRSKNMLSLVQSIARMTAAENVDDFVSLFAERIQALAANQDLLVRNEWKGVALEDLVRSQLAHVQGRAGARIALRGGLVVVSAAAAQTIGMALHELATNAAKYGALFNDVGRIEVVWHLSDEADGVQDLTISWTERDGPAVTPPVRRGFGSTVLERMAKMSLGGEVELDFAAEGLAWRLVCPVENVLQGGRQGTAASLRTAGGLARVLVVEDEALVGLEIASALTDAGLQVVGTAPSVAAALELLRQDGCDVAVLDVNLGTETAEPVARELVARRIPFVVVSGYARDQQPAIFQAAPLIKKPFRSELLVAEVRRGLGRRDPDRYH